MMTTFTSQPETSTKATSKSTLESMLSTQDRAGEYDSFSVVETKSGILLKEHNIEEIFKGDPKEFTVSSLISKGHVSFKFDLQLFGIG